ncbi:FadR/GntR family transcriptional regulator [Streptomyces virginiae]|uniref:FadR/GntR family transcriptional regulator n=2 Tax=Streptomyces TaxID=1883 RepID=UPI003D80082C
MWRSPSEILPTLARRNPQWLTELFEVRRAMGALIARQAAVRASPADKKRLLHRLRAVGNATSATAVQLADAEVHREIARASANRVYVLLTNALLNAYRPVRGACESPFVSPRASEIRLTPLVAAVISGDAAGAYEAAHTYLESTERSILVGLQ